MKEELFKKARCIGKSIPDDTKIQSESIAIAQRKMAEKQKPKKTSQK